MLEEDKEFDLKIRSILEDSQEEVPDRLWEAIQQRLPAKKHRPVVIWLRRSAAAVAAAAAAAAFFCLGPDLPVGPRHHDGLSMDLSADAGIQVIGKSSATDGFSPALAETIRTEPVMSEAVPQAIGAAPLSDAQTAPYPTSGNDIPGTVPQQTSVNATARTEDKAEESDKAIIPDKGEGQDKRDRSDRQTPSADMWNDTETLDADIDAVKRKIPVAMTVSGNAISNSTQGKSARGLDPMQSSGVPPANSLHEEMATSYGIPISFGAGVKVFFDNRWSLGAGINYSLLSRTLSGIYYNEDSTPFSDSDILNTQSYIGIPVNVYFSILKKDFIDLYAYAGGTVEKCVSSRYLIDAPGQTLTYREKSRGVQLSADLGIGVEFLVIDRLGIYIDPSVRYYFKSSQPKSIRTVQPLMIGFEAGLRVRL